MVAGGRSSLQPPFLSRRSYGIVPTPPREKAKGEIMPGAPVSTLAAVAVMIPAFACASTWEIDSAHTSAQFAIRHLMVSTVRGDFGKIRGVVNVDEQDITKSSVEATIDTTTINTRVAKRDEHLKGPDFLNV